jgi:hypothetical protein
MKVTEILNIEKINIWQLEEKDYEVEHDDGVTIVNSKNQLIFNRYCWELFNLYPGTPVPSKCNLKTILGDSLYTADTHIKLLESIFKAIIEFNNISAYSDKDRLLKAVYLTYNDIYNNVVLRASDAVFTMDATDFIDVVNNERIKSIHDSIKPNPDSIEKAYKRLKIAMREFDPSNRFARAFNSKAINENQANQCIGPRGFVSDLDRTVFKQPVMNGFIRGLDTLYEIMVESRTAAKSLNASSTHIQTSEYGSRRIQLLSMYVQNIVHEDCGSTDYMDILITPSILKNIRGKYYLQEDGSLGCIDGSEDHLIDKVIKIRNVLDCKYKEAKKICSICAGKLSNNFKENSNLGYVTAAFLMEKSTQTILSTKHLTHSVKEANIQLEGLANKYFYVDVDNYIYFNKDINLKNLQLILPNNKLNKLVDVLNIKHNNIALNKIGELEEICIVDNGHPTPIVDIVNISYKDRLSILTNPLLNYIKTTKLDTDPKGNFIINLADFDRKKPVFYNPLKETDMVSFVKHITKIIETIKKDWKTPEDKLALLFKHVLDRFNCNIFILETIVYSTSIYNPYTYNYSLGRNSEHRASESRTNIFKFRSSAAFLVLEDQQQIIKEPAIIFNPRHRIDHPMDVLFSPSDVINISKSKSKLL